MTKKNGSGEGFEPSRNAVRTGEVALNGDYTGWTATMRLNPPAKLFDDFKSGDEDRLEAVLKLIVLDWNFVDDEGRSLPLPKENLDWTEAPWDLKRSLVEAYGKAMMARLEPPKETSTSSEPGEQNGTS